MAAAIASLSMRAVGVLIFGAVLMAAAPASAANRTEGTNSANSSQRGSSSSGDAVGGPSLSVSRARDVRVEATNLSGTDGATVRSVRITPGVVSSVNVQGPISVTSGDASGSNEAVAFVGTSATGSALADVLTAVLR